MNRNPVRRVLSSAVPIRRQQGAPRTPSSGLGGDGLEPRDLTAETQPMLFPIGHFYSPMYDLREIGASRARIWPDAPRETLDMDWREQDQLALCNRVFAAQEPLSLRTDVPDSPAEYWCGNDQFPPLDASVLAAMLRHLRPKRMIEVGSGYSSLVTARINRDELDKSMCFTCIEPYPREFLQDGVDGISNLRIELIQDTPLEIFEALGDKDVLFIDTSHTVKTGGDVTWIFHEIVPRLKKGVVVHVHDFFLPEEYPEVWVEQGRGWNESYLVRSFLSYNDAFHILWAVRYMLIYHDDAVTRAFRLRDNANRAGGSLWFQRVR
jgi:predicted O-methyltransferase YrrM